MLINSLKNLKKSNKTFFNLEKGNLIWLEIARHGLKTNKIFINKKMIKPNLGYAYWTYHFSSSETYSIPFNHKLQIHTGVMDFPLLTI